jgi:hypothetical protein
MLLTYNFSLISSLLFGAWTISILIDVRKRIPCATILLLFTAQNYFLYERTCLCAFPQAIAVVVGLCYTNTVMETQAGIQSVQGALLIFVTENTFTPMYSVLAFFPLELPLFVREYSSGLYSTHLYYLSKIAAMVSGCSVVYKTRTSAHVIRTWDLPLL